MQRKAGDLGRKKFLHPNSSSDFSFTPKSYDVVGDIAIVKASLGDKKKAQEIADAIGNFDLAFEQCFCFITERDEVIGVFGFDADLDGSAKMLTIPMII